MNQQTLFFIGRSGSGKGTQAKLVIKYLEKNDPDRKVFYLESGEKFRTLIAGTTYTSELSRKINIVGGLQPEFLAIWIWSTLLVENMTGKEHVIFDGVPRKRHEASVLDSAMGFYGREKPTVIFIDVSREWSKERLLARKRADDTASDIEARLNWFDTDVVPTIAYFKENPMYEVHQINGERTIEEIHTDILEKLGWQK